jgi:putative membrane protein
MSRGSFFDDAAKRRTTEAIREIESTTAAEVVVSVSPRASRYHVTTLAFSAACALMAFLVMWFSPVVYDVRTIPLDVALVFVVTFAFAYFSDVVRGRLTPKKLRHTKVHEAATKAFTDLGITKTRDRTGMLVFVSLLEREVELILDEGIAGGNLGSEFETAKKSLASAVQKRDIDAFEEALKRLAPPLSVLLPRHEDDVNELSDEVV